MAGKDREPDGLGQRPQDLLNLAALLAIERGWEGQLNGDILRSWKIGIR